MRWQLNFVLCAPCPAGRTFCQQRFGEKTLKFILRFFTHDPDSLGATVVKENCIISPDWEAVIEGGFQQSSSWASLFEIARKLEVRNMKIEIHTGA